MRRLLATAWLVIVWVALWGQLSWANLLGGVAVALLIGLAFPGTGAGPAGRVRPLPAVHFAGWFAYKLVEATLAVSLEVLRAHPRIAGGSSRSGSGTCPPALPPWWPTSSPSHRAP